MFGKNFFVVALVILVVFSSLPVLFAGEVELTTYYPAPTGEYSSIQATQTLKVPVKTVGTDTTQVTPGEIWVEG